MEGESFGPGVYLSAGGGEATLVHPYQGGNYRLGDVVDIFQLGRIDADDGALVLEAGEVRKLKMLADAFSFDYDEEFIEMCHALHRVAQERPESRFRFTATF